MLKPTLIIACVIVFVIALFCGFFVVSSSEINEEPSQDSMTLEEKVDYYNAHMSDDERTYRNYCGLGNESIGENYNSMGEGGVYHQ